jgi:hypothetical protein
MTEPASDSNSKISRRACSDPVGNFTIDPETNQPIQRSGKGCQVCDNDDRYGFGKSTCGKCGRCHGCGSSNNGIGPLQAVYFGGKSVVKKAGEMIGGGEKKS